MKSGLLAFPAILIAATSWASSTPGGSGNNSHDPTIPVDISGITNGVSEESARNEIDANIDDWKNETAQVSSLKQIACRDTKIEEVIFSQALVPSPILVVDGVEAFSNGNFKGVALTAAENEQLQAIHSAPRVSQADRIQYQISLQQLAMAVSNRSYADAIETYRLRAVAAESYGKLDGVADRCNEYSLRTLRDQDMITAANVLLNLYSQLDQANH